MTTSPVQTKIPFSRPRRSAMVERVREAMSDGGWYTDFDLVAITGISILSIGQRRRDLRLKEYGQCEIQDRKRPDGLTEYRLVEGGGDE